MKLKVTQPINEIFKSSVFFVALVPEISEMTPKFSQKLLVLTVKNEKFSEILCKSQQFFYKHDQYRKILLEMRYIFIQVRLKSAGPAIFFFITPYMEFKKKVGFRSSL